MAQSGKTNWTKEQREAIGARGGETLVSAGAGSGKTAVLVERVIGLILDPVAPVDLEAILAVTFTDEAAGEMRRRVRSALEARLSEDDADPRLEKQLAFLEQANISTIHSFCFRLLRENFHLLGLDPQAEMLDEEQGRLLQLETLDDVFEAKYSARDETGRLFMEMAERYGGGRGDTMLRESVLTLHNLLESVLDPGEWLGAALAQYDEPERWIEAWKKEVAEEIKASARFYESRANDVACAGIFGKFLSFALEESERLKRLADALDSDPAGAAFNALADWQWPRLPSLRGPSEAEKAAWDAYKSARERAKNSIGAASGVSLDAARESIRRLRPLAGALADLTVEFREAFARAKSMQGALDFSDLERLAFTLLRNGDGSPSPVAQRMRKRFEHVIIDEYQDINPLQDAILSYISRTEAPNRFMVGDVKQCIYGFRLAEPALFLAKQREFSSGAGSAQKTIYLSANFRSRPEVLNSVNAVFRRIMAPCLGGLKYGNEEDLRPGLEHGDPPSDGGIVEFALIDSAAADDAPAVDPLEAEALEAGRRILAWTGSSGQAPLLINDPKTREARPARLDDIVILMRTVTGRGGRFAETLRNMGIPVSMSSETAFFEAMEISDVLSLLRLLDNPRQDIPLAAALRSPIFKFNENDLAEIRIASPAPTFHEAAALMARDGAKTPLGERLGRFFSRLETWRDTARTSPLPDLLRKIFSDTGYADYVGGLPGGEHRQARLEGLVERARRFSATRHATLYRFLRFIEDMADREIQIKAPPPPPGGDAVRIMTVHQSKGLEFPIVFLPDLAKRFNFQDAMGNALFDRQGGIGLNEINLERGERYRTLPNRVVASRVRERARAEEARLLYVAMTRARERLVVSATVNFEKAFPVWRAAGGDGDGPLPPAILLSANSAIDWLGPALAGMPEGRMLDADGRMSAVAAPRFRITLAFGDYAESCGGETEDAPSSAWLERFRGRQPLAENWRDDEIAVRMEERLAWRYPDSQLCSLSAKVGVSELKSRLSRSAEQDEEIAQPFVPQSPRPALSAQQRGVLLHAILQRLDLGQPKIDLKEIESQARSMAEKGFFDPEDLKKADLSPLERFLSSERGQWLIEHRKSLRRELAFTWSLPASSILPELQGDEARARLVTVQGVIDALVETTEGMWLLDYKSDIVKPDEMAGRAKDYEPQMALYAQAIQSIFGAPPIGAALIFLSANAEFSCDVAELADWSPERR
jgi:ATP-dependent helicase/nuclease subunit A